MSYHQIWNFFERMREETEFRNYIMYLIDLENDPICELIRSCHDDNIEKSSIN